MLMWYAPVRFKPLLGSISLATGLLVTLDAQAQPRPPTEGNDAKASAKQPDQTVKTKPQVNPSLSTILAETRRPSSPTYAEHQYRDAFDTVGSGKSSDAIEGSGPSAEVVGALTIDQITTSSQTRVSDTITSFDKPHAGADNITAYHASTPSVEDLMDDQPPIKETPQVHSLAISQVDYALTAVTDKRLSDLLGAVGSKSRQSQQALAERLLELSRLTEDDPEMALSLAVSLYEHWDQPKQSERILNKVLSLADRIAGQQGLEAQVTVIRWFLGRLDEPTLRHRVQLRLGRLYYQSGDFGKAVVELPVDRTQQAPDQFQSLSGLYKAVSLIRVQKPEPALPLLAWVATKSPSLAQRTKAALLLGRLHALYQQPDKARPWLRFVAERAEHGQTRKQARQLIQKLNRQARDS